MRWYVARAGKSAGPVSEETLASYARAGKLAGAMVRDENSPGWTPVEQSPFATLIQPASAGARRSWPMWQNVVAGLFILLVLLVVAWEFRGLVGNVRGSQPAPETVQKTPARIPTRQERLNAAASLPDALAIMRPHFAANNNTLSTAPDPAAVVFALWANRNMHWSELGLTPKGSYGETMKDPAAERGKHLCVSGEIVEIAIDRSTGADLYFGGIVSDAMDVTRFIAFGSTRSLVQKSRAGICGIVTGRMSYLNAGGGTTHAVHIVGMFDLPENRTTAPEQGADE